MKPTPNVYQDESTWAYMTRTWYELVRGLPAAMIALSVFQYGGASTGEAGGYIAAAAAVAGTIAFLNQFENWFCWCVLPGRWYRGWFCTVSPDMAFATFPGAVMTDRKSSRVFFVVRARGTNRDKSLIPELATAAEWMLDNMPVVAAKYATVAKLARRFGWQPERSEFIFVSHRRGTQPPPSTPITAPEAEQPTDPPSCSTPSCLGLPKSSPCTQDSPAGPRFIVWPWYYPIVLIGTGGFFWLATYVSSAYAPSSGGGGWPDVLVRVFAGVVGTGLGLLLGPTVVKRFADYVAARQWLGSREAVLEAVAGHLSRVLLQVYVHFETTDVDVVAIVVAGSIPNTRSNAAVSSIGIQMQQNPLPKSQDKSLAQTCVDYYAKVAWDLEELAPLIQRVAHSLAKPDTFMALQHVDNRRKTLLSLTKDLNVAEEARAGDFMPLFVSTVADAYRRVAEEWSECRSDDDGDDEVIRMIWPDEGQS